MSEQPPDAEPATEPTTDTTAEPTTEWERRRRRAAVFGDSLPDTTSDERDPATPEGESGSDRWLREQVPPHHGS